MKFFFKASYRLLIYCILGLGSLHAQDTLKVMYYNVLNYPGSTSGRVEYFRTVTSYVQPDVLLISELISDEGALLLLNDGLNTGGTSSYQKAQFTNGTDSENMLFYNSNKLTLYSQDTIVTNLRLINEYVLYENSGNPLGADTNFMYFYSAHLKASTGPTNRQKRMEEVMLLKQHLQEKGLEKNIFFGGDLNFYSATEPAYDSILTAGPVPLIDPLPAGNWHNSVTYAAIHTQSTRTAQFGGGASGGIDDRFDFIFFSQDIIDGSHGIHYIPNSCKTFGNDGLHFNQSLLDAPGNSTLPDSVIQALYYMSDHMPVVCNIAVDNPQAPISRTLNVKVFLEGPFVGDSMAIGNDFVIPQQQPYSTSPWNYQGNELLNAAPQAGIIDWILLEIRETPGDASSADLSTTIWEKACLLRSDGQLVGTDQISLPVLDVPTTDHLFVVLYHRNHLDIMSAFPMNQNNDTASYLFYDAADKTFGIPSGVSQLLNGFWGMAAGDCDGNGTIDQSDLHNYWLIRAGHSGYLPADVNFDFEIDNTDKNQNWIGNLGKYSSIPE